MAFTSGFFDSINGDRTYSAVQFGEMFDGLINDGVYQNIGEHFAVTPGIGIQVFVGSGRAWFNHTWNVNTTTIPIDLTIPDLLLPRIDVIVLEIDTRVSVRGNSIKAIDGYPSTNPVAPTINTDPAVYQYPLAHVRVDQNASTIASGKITSKIGTADCPWVSPVMNLISIQNAYAAFDKQFHDWLNGLKNNTDESVLVSLKFQLDEAEAALAQAQARADKLQSDLNTIKNSL